MRQKEKLEVNFRSKLALPKRTKSGSVWGFKHDCSSTRTNPAGPESFLEKFHYRQKNFQIFENFLWHSTRLGEPEKTALADFLRFFALKKVFWNHLGPFKNSVQMSRSISIICLDSKLITPTFMAKRLNCISKLFEDFQNIFQTFSNFPILFKSLSKPL